MGMAATLNRQYLQNTVFSFFIRSFALFSCPLSWGWRVSLFAPGARDQNAANLAGTTGGGYNLFCGEVYRLPLDLCQHPGGLAAIVDDGCAL